MARRTPSKTTDAAPKKATQEETVTTVTEEPGVEVDESTESTESTAPDSDEEVFGAFDAAVEEAMGLADPSTGEVPTAAREAVAVAFRNLEGAKHKNRARARLTEEMKSAMNELNVAKARGYVLLSEAVSPSATSGSAPKPAADPTEAFVNQATTLRLAASLIKATVPENVSEDWAEKANGLYDSEKANAVSYLEWTQADEAERGDEPDVSNVVKSAVKLAQSNVLKTRRGAGRPAGTGGPRHDVGKHLEEAFAGVESGEFLSINQIQKFKSEEYGDAVPSAGAISNRLFPKTGEVTVEGIRPGKQGSSRGAFKI